jgi:hypothetical protein
MAFLKMACSVVLLMMCLSAYAMRNGSGSFRAIGEHTACDESAHTELYYVVGTASIWASYDKASGRYWTSAEALRGHSYTQKESKGIFELMRNDFDDPSNKPLRRYGDSDSE